RQVRCGGQRRGPARALGLEDCRDGHDAALPRRSWHRTHGDSTPLWQPLACRKVLPRRHSEPLPHLDTVVVAGGGLIDGIVAWYAGTANLVGVEPDEAATLTAALTICTRHTSA